MGWWIWVIRSISASISNEFARDLQNSMVFPDIRFIYTSKNVNSDLTIEREISMIKYSLLSENPL